LGVKRQGREADHSPPSSAEVKNAWSYTSTPVYAFKAWCLVKAQGQLIHSSNQEEMNMKVPWTNNLRFLAGIILK
jgi:hypothetical protein